MTRAIIYYSLFSFIHSLYSLSVTLSFELRTDKRTLKIYIRISLVRILINAR